jgi:prepilin-type N-terminal cleavage/methylation domain-containing protein
MNPVAIRAAGFTLIEILIAMLITSVAILALGSLSISIMSGGQLANERLSAVHLAGQVLELWQNNQFDAVPSIAADCVLTDATAASTSTVTTTCTPASGMKVAFTITASQTQATGPLPSNLSSFQNFTAPTSLTLTPMTKLVSVAWTNQGQSHSVYLTHLSAVK